MDFKKCVQDVQDLKKDVMEDQHSKGGRKAMRKCLYEHCQTTIPDACQSVYCSNICHSLASERAAQERTVVEEAIDQVRAWFDEWAQLANVRIVNNGIPQPGQITILVWDLQYPAHGRFLPGRVNQSLGLVRQYLLEKKGDVLRSYARLTWIQAMWMIEKTIRKGFEDAEAQRYGSQPVPFVHGWDVREREARTTGEPVDQPGASRTAHQIRGNEEERMREAEAPRRQAEFQVLSDRAPGEPFVQWDKQQLAESAKLFIRACKARDLEAEFYGPVIG